MSTTPNRTGGVSLAKSFGMTVAKKTQQELPPAHTDHPPEDEEEDEAVGQFEHHEDPADPIEEYEDEDAHPDQDVEGDDAVEEEPPKRRKSPPPAPKKARPASKKAKVDSNPAAAAEGDAFTLQNVTPRDGIALEPTKGSNSKIKLLRLLYAPPNPTIFPWSVAAEKSFMPRYDDIFRAWVRYTHSDSSTSDHFILLVKTHKPHKSKNAGEETEPAPDLVRYRWLNKDTENRLFRSRNLTNGTMFPESSSNIELIDLYHNRLPGPSNLKREGFVSDHVAQANSPDVYTSPLSFYQEPNLLKGELDFYMPIDILNNPGANELAEQGAVDALVDEEEEEAFEAEENAAAADDEIDVVPWTERPPAKVAAAAKAKRAPAAPAKAKSRVKSISAVVLNTTMASTQAEATPLPAGMRRQVLGPEFLGTREEPDLTSLIMPDVAKLVSANDYQVALAEAEVADGAVTEPDLNNPPPAPPKKKRAPSKAKGAPSTTPSAVPKSQKVTPAVVPLTVTSTPKRKTAPEGSEQVPKRVAVEPAAKIPAAPKKNGKKPSTNPDQGVQNRAPSRLTAALTDEFQLRKIPVSFVNLDIGENMTPKLVDPKLKAFAVASAKARPECESLINQEYELSRWFKVVEELTKPESAAKNKPMFNLIVVILEMVCRRLKTNQLNFGSLDALRSRSRNLFARLIDDLAFAKFLVHYHESAEVLLDNAGSTCNLIRFIEFCVCAEVHIGDHMLEVIKHADLKLEVDQESMVEYRKTNRDNIGFVCAATQLVKEFYEREDQAAAGNDDDGGGAEEKPDEEEADALDDALVW